MQKELTKMLDNLYLDKLKGRITESEYDKFYQSLKEQSQDLDDRLKRLEEANDDFYMTSRSILGLINQAYELFESSEVEERRQLIKLVLSNLRVENEKVLYEVVKPFDLLVEKGKCKEWYRESDSNRHDVAIAGF